MRRTVLSLIVAGLMMALMAAPALAVNHGQVPANECAASPEAGGRQAADNLRATGQVEPPASLNNPGESTGAQGEARSNACPSSEA
jgi:hypothetical protein